MGRTGAVGGAGSSVVRPLIVCRPSGVGKGTIISCFMGEGGGGGSAAVQRCLQEFTFSVLHMSRDPWPGEVDGMYYHFVSREVMLRAVLSGTFFIKHTKVHGNMYSILFWSLFPDRGARGLGSRGGEGGLDVWPNVSIIIVVVWR